jgi:PAS domain S-box-containing protein
MDSIGDAVFRTDVAGNITYLNAVAEYLTGWPQERARGRRFREVFRIIEANNRATALDPLAMAIRGNEPFSLDADCVLIRRDGHETAIEDTAAPIRNGTGQVVGGVIIAWLHAKGSGRGRREFFQPGMKALLVR